MDPLIQSAVSSIPAGRWGVAVSSGADSVALLMLLVGRSDVFLHVIHLDHQTRGQESRADAEFVKELAQRHRLAATLASRGQLEVEMTGLPGNLSARYRSIRFELFRRTAREHELEGVILAHHADDQAETILHRLIRGSAAWALGGMSEWTRIHELLVVRPLLRISRAALREYLVSINQTWREDSSNVSGKYLRNRLRPMLAGNPDLRRAVLELGEACRDLRSWACAAAPRLTADFRASQLAALPDVLARQSARRWLADRGVPVQEISENVIAHLRDMAADAASPPRAQFPAGLLVRRRGGVISVVR